MISTNVILEQAWVRGIEPRRRYFDIEMVDCTMLLRCEYHKGKAPLDEGSWSLARFAILLSWNRRTFSVTLQSFKHRTSKLLQQHCRPKGYVQLLDKHEWRCKDCGKGPQCDEDRDHRALESYGRLMDAHSDAVLPHGSLADMA